MDDPTPPRTLRDLLDPAAAELVAWTGHSTNSRLHLSAACPAAGRVHRAYRIQPTMLTVRLCRRCTPARLDPTAATAAADAFAQAAITVARRSYQQAADRFTHNFALVADLADLADRYHPSGRHPHTTAIRHLTPGLAAHPDRDLVAVAGLAHLARTAPVLDGADLATLGAPASANPGAWQAAATLAGSGLPADVAIVATVDGLHRRVLPTIADLPDRLRYDRADYPTTAVWLNAEWAAAVGDAAARLTATMAGHLATWTAAHRADPLTVTATNKASAALIERFAVAHHQPVTVAHTGSVVLVAADPHLLSAAAMTHGRLQLAPIADRAVLEAVTADPETLIIAARLLADDGWWPMGDLDRLHTALDQAALLTRSACP